jgi:hypothetical protein
MRSLLLVIASFTVTILGWGLYVPMLRWGQVEMAEIGAPPARWRPYMCVGFAYFLIGVIVPIVLLRMKGERGEWTTRGILFSLLGGVLGAVGALGIILAINFGGDPIYVAPLVFGAAPVVNSFLTIYLAGKMREIGPFFLAGLVMVVLGAVTVLSRAPHAPPPVAERPAANAAAESADANAAEPAATPTRVERAKTAASSMVLQILSIALVALCWGSYGPTLHKGQAAMMNSRLRPLLCVGMAYFLIAVCVPPLILSANPEASRFSHATGTFWSLMAGAAGAIGALGIIMAFNFGGKPVFVMPLVFGGAPVVATLVSTASQGLMDQLGPMFLAGLILVIAGSAMVLVFAPKGAPHAPSPVSAPPPAVTPAHSPPETAHAGSAESAPASGDSP